jgi:hypothetical protein
MAIDNRRLLRSWPIVRRALQVAGLALLTACESSVPATKQDSASSEPWKIPSEKACILEEQPIIRLLQSYNDDVLADHRGEKIWNEELCYLTTVWTQKQKDRTLEHLENGPGTRIEWAWLEFDPAHEFARIRTRWNWASVRVIPVSGISVCRKFKDGWKLFSWLPSAINFHMPDWAQIYMEQAIEGPNRRFDPDGAGRPVPE